ncbi:MAG: hypothetical protein CEE40_08335 [Chloroflexi bacterium B3_Chlor]|nr:MAG: hypothetical protein CEE40_08335 [Chloroflexi bacterium B3_Chlor]
MRLRLSLLLGALISTVVLTTACASIGGSHKPVITLYDGQWESLWVNNALAEFIIRDGYGYPVETVVVSSQVMQERLPKGEIDLDMEIWQHSRIDWYNDQIENGNIVNLGMTYEAGPQFFVIPAWVAERYDIKTVYDMQEQWELFRDPGDSTKGVFYNCIIAWRCDEINEVKLEAYGLTRYYNLISPASEEALETVLERAQRMRQPVFGYYWAPTWLMGAYDWHILEEPPYTPECWEQITAAVEDESQRPLDQACAYADVAIDKVAHRGLLQKAPDVAEMLRRMFVGLEPLNDTLAWARQNDVNDWEEAAIYYLQIHEDRWKTWVTPEAYKNIKEALLEASG